MKELARNPVPLVMDPGIAIIVERGHVLTAGVIVPRNVPSVAATRK